MGKRSTVLVISGSDSSGGAGVARDIQVLADHGVDAAIAITAVTAQTDTCVASIQHMAAELVRDQMRCALESRDITAIKIGMLGRGETVRAVFESLPSRNAIPVILDPVLVSSSGQSLLDEDGREALRNDFLARVTLVTPNLPEAALLLEVSEALDEHATLVQAQRLMTRGPEAVLLKGGHAIGSESTDLLVLKGGDTMRFSSSRVAVKVRGSGCMLASGIAAGLAMGMTLAQACGLAKRYLARQFQAGHCS